MFHPPYLFVIFTYVLTVGAITSFDRKKNEEKSVKP